MSENNFETIASYFWINDAELARIELESQGVEAKIEDSEIAAANPFLSNAAGGIKLKVRKDDILKASQILKDIEDGKKDKYHVSCPQCESTDITEKRFPAWGLLLSVVTLGFFFVAAYRPYHCNSCGYKWR